MGLPRSRTATTVFTPNALVALMAVRTPGPRGVALIGVLSSLATVAPAMAAS
jgi:hypothetical protein